MTNMKKESTGHSIRLRSAADKGTLGSYVFSSMEGSASYLRDLVSIPSRYIAEFSDGDAKSKAAENARLAYEEAHKVAEKDLPVTHPIRLGLVLNYSVFQYEVLQNPDKACKMARTAFGDAP